MFAGERNANTQRFENRKFLKRIRTRLPLTPISSSTTLTRAYFRVMRDAEMAAWEATGGDYVRSSFATRA